MARDETVIWSDSDQAARVVRPAVNRRPDLFLIGAAKCGTTSLWQWLRGHPEVFMSPRKEPRFFAPDLHSGSAGKNLRYPQDMARYLELFAGARGEQRLGEATARYIYSRSAPGLIQAFEPNAFIVAALRNPIDMMHSLHAHHVAGGTEPIADFGRALAAERKRRSGVGLRRESNPQLTLYRERARFGEQLTRWFDKFPPERIHVIIFEEMVADPATTFRQLLEFLQVDPGYQPAAFVDHNPRHEPRSTLLRSALKSGPGRLLLWRALPALLGDDGARALLSPLRKINRSPVRRSPVEPALRLQLQRELDDDVAIVSRLLGRDMAAQWWMAHDEPVQEEQEQESVGLGAAS